MTEEEVIEHVLAMAYPASTCVLLTPPNKVGTQSIFWVHQPSADEPEFHEAHMFSFEQTYWFQSGEPVQLWRGPDGLYAARIGVREPLRFCGDILSFPIRYRDLFPLSADESAAERQLEIQELA